MKHSKILNLMTGVLLLLSAGAGNTAHAETTLEQTITVKGDLAAELFRTLTDDHGAKPMPGLAKDYIKLRGLFIKIGFDPNATYPVSFIDEFAQPFSDPKHISNASPEKLISLLDAVGISDAKDSTIDYSYIYVKEIACHHPQSLCSIHAFKSIPALE